VNEEICPIFSFIISFLEPRLIECEFVNIKGVTGKFNDVNLLMLLLDCAIIPFLFILFKRGWIFLLEKFRFVEIYNHLKNKILN